MPAPCKRAVSSVVERFVYTEDVGSSTLSPPTILALPPAARSFAPALRTCALRPWLPQVSGMGLPSVGARRLSFAEGDTMFTPRGGRTGKLGRQMTLSISMYQASVPAIERTLKALDAILDKAAAYSAERK